MPTTRPRIAVTSCRTLPDYEAAVAQAGGDPVVVTPGATSAADILAGCDGLLLPGGGDVDPALYGAAAHATFSPAEPARDAFELTLARLARAADHPLLAICRGIQVLNVARGGDLVQDLPSERPSVITHRVPVPPDGVAHAVRVEPGSSLARLMASRISADGRMDVNSRHHQAVNRLGDGLRIVATADDGVVEAVDDPTARFCVGVQWHPENFWRSGAFLALFQGFVDAAR